MRRKREPEVVVNLVGDLFLAHVKTAACRQKWNLATKGNLIKSIRLYFHLSIDDR